MAKEEDEKKRTIEAQLEAKAKKLEEARAEMACHEVENNKAREAPVFEDSTP